MRGILSVAVLSSFIMLFYYVQTKLPQHYCHMYLYSVYALWFLIIFVLSPGYLHQGAPSGGEVLVEGVNCRSVPQCRVVFLMLWSLWVLVLLFTRGSPFMGSHV